MKPALRKRKGEVLAEKMISKKGTRLTLDDYGACVKQPVEEAFSRARNLASWDKIGVVPFTRRVYWELKAEEEEAAALANQAEAPTWNKGAAQFPSNSGGGGGGGGGGDDDEGVAPVGDGTDRSQHNRLTSADLWNLGAVTTDTAHAMVKEKAQDRQQKEQEKAARKASKEQAATDKLQDAVLNAQSVLTRLTAEGVHLTTCAVPDLTAKCNAGELYCLLLTVDSKAKKGTKVEMATALLAAAASIGAANTATAAAAAAGP